MVARAEKDLLMYLNNTDFQVFKLRDIVIFRYDNEKKKWHIFIANHHEPIPMKHSVSSTDILNLSNQFVQVHKKFIINIYYLQSVRDSICHFYPPFEDIKGVKISFKYRKHLLEMFSNL
jgi:two-component system LytT family response regulator